MTAKTQTGDGRDTIFALASAPGRAGVAVIRLSGPGVDVALQALTKGELPLARHAVLRALSDPQTQQRIDTGLVLRFPAPHSYTGEDVAELQIHGGRAVIAALARALSGLGLRPAEPGEFTRRAVEAGRLDLTQAEGLADLVVAETEAQRRQALSQLEGGLRILCEDWRAKLIRAAAWMEARLDFPDEEVPEQAISDSKHEIKKLLNQLNAYLNGIHRGEILREGLQVAVIGAPNVGKSSLVNALARRDVAIVSEIAGTTRDVIEVRLDIGGYPVILADTAGIREAQGIEEEGVRRARARAKSADLRLWVRDATAPDAGEDLGKEGDTLEIWNKADLAPNRSHSGLFVSAQTGEGLAELLAMLGREAEARAFAGESPGFTRERHRQALTDAVQGLELGLAAPDDRPELAAEGLRQALAAIGRLTGRVDLDEVLDVVFRDFCIGK